MQKSSLQLQQEMVQTAYSIAQRLQGLSEADLAKPVQWHNADFTVRFLLHRLAGHLMDHLNQLRKVRQGIDQPPTEAQMILGQYFAAQALVLGELAGLSEAQLAQPEREGEWSANQVLEHLLNSQKKALTDIEKAVGATSGK